MKKKAYPVSRVYRLIEAGPVVLVATARGGRNNVMTLSWHTMLEFVPALIGCVISADHYTFDTLKATKECVIAIPTVELAKKVVRVGRVSGRDMNKFTKFGLTAEPASLVKAPLVAECFANIECKLVDTSMINKYSFFVLEAVKAWIDPTKKEPKTIHHHGKGVFTVDGKKINVPFHSIEP